MGKFLLAPLLAASLLLSACLGSGNLPDPASGPPQQALTAAERLAATGARVADALGVAPPAMLRNTTIVERSILLAIDTFRGAMAAITLVVDNTSWLPRNSPRALTVRRGVRLVQRLLNAAHAAQRAGNAEDYRTLLTQAMNAVSATRRAMTGN